MDRFQGIIGAVGSRERMIMLKVYRILCVLLMLVVLYLSLIPIDDDFVSTGWDKANHFLAFFSLAALMDIAFPRTAFWPIKLPVLVAYGLLIEVLQSFTGYRFFSWLDLFADTLAVFCYFPLRAVNRAMAEKFEHLLLNH